MENAQVVFVDVAFDVDDGLPVRVSPAEMPDQTGPQNTLEGGLCGWRGKGPPRKVRGIGCEKPFADGGGLCSPGRWAPENRRFPGFPADLLRDVLLDEYRRILHPRRDGATDPTAMTFRIAAGVYNDNPFSGDDMERIRGIVKKHLGLHCDQCGVAAGQSFRLEMFSELLRYFGDPDWAFFKELEQGVNIGVDCPMPRTPAVFEEKFSWRLEEWAGQEESEVANYRSIAGFEERVQQLFREEEALGWMAEMSDEEARAKYGDNLYVAALGVVDEGEKIRVVHDGTHGVQINHRIRPRDQIRCPSAGEIQEVLRGLRERGSKGFALMGDASKAHRRIKVREEDWGYQACRTQPGRLWLNKVGTYGIASAAYFWSRFAAGAMVRLVHYLIGRWMLEILLCSDDFLWVALTKQGVELLGFIVAFFAALGVEFKWAKFRGGTEGPWIGYWVDIRGFQLGLSEKRASWLTGWLRQRINEAVVDMDDFRAVLGRLGFALAPLEHIRPFTAPLFAWAAAVAHRGQMRIPWSILFIFAYLADLLEGNGRLSTVYPRGKCLGDAFRADAKADGAVSLGWGMGIPRREATTRLMLVRS